MLRVNLHYADVSTVQRRTHLRTIIRVDQRAVLSTRLPTLSLRLGGKLLTRYRADSPARYSPRTVTLRAIEFIGSVGNVCALRPTKAGVRRFSLPVVLEFYRPIRHVSSLLSCQTLSLAALELATGSLNQSPCARERGPARHIRSYLSQSVGRCQRCLALVAPPTLTTGRSQS